MIDISWGESLVLFGVGIALIGRNDLPRASRVLGRQVGRVVGVLQGARARAERFTADNELTALQNELRSGLRELDVVRGELAVAATGPRGLGSMVPGANRIGGGGIGGGVTGLGAAGMGGAASSTAASAAAAAPSAATGLARLGVQQAVPSGQDYLAAARSAEALSSSASAPQHQQQPLGLAPRSQSVAAVAEEEWTKRGIGFVSRAERGTAAWEGTGGSDMSGAILLADVIQQSLIHDQYERAVREQDEALDRRAERIRQENEDKKKEEGRRSETVNS